MAERDPDDGDDPALELDRKPAGNGGGGSGGRPRDPLGRPLPAGSADALRPVDLPDASAPLERWVDLAVELFDAERFFEAHEVLETVWKRDGFDDESRRWWRGLTQLAVACCHLQRGNLPGARGVLARAMTNLGMPVADAGGLDPGAVHRSAQGLAMQLQLRDRALPGVREFPRLGPSGLGRGDNHSLD